MHIFEYALNAYLKNIFKNMRLEDGNHFLQKKKGNCKIMTKRVYIQWLNNIY